MSLRRTCPYHRSLVKFGARIALQNYETGGSPTGGNLPAIYENSSHRSCNPYGRCQRQKIVTRDLLIPHVHYMQSGAKVLSHSKLLQYTRYGGVSKSRINNPLVRIGACLSRSATLYNVRVHCDCVRYNCTRCNNLQGYSHSGTRLITCRDGCRKGP